MRAATIKLPRPYLLGLVLLTALLTWFAWNTNAPRMGFVLANPSDPLGYYQWLPWTFFHGDWSAMPYVHYLPNGNGLSLFTMGVAILQAPFFLLAWLYCELTGTTATGFELPFVFARLLAASAYTAGGISLIFWMLRRRVDTLSGWMTCGAILFATTLYFYTVHEGGMSHAYSFFLITWVVYLTYRMVEAPRWDRLLALFIGLSLIILIRPLNGIIAVFVVFAGSEIRTAISTRLRWFIQHPKTSITGALVAAAMWLPQLFYWQMQTGSWLVFTYGKKNESFDFSDPHLIETLFSFQNGWFPYTPVMLLAVGMLLWQTWKGSGDARVTVVVWCTVWYVYASWWCWWLGSAYGYRGFLELYALFAFPLAALLARPLRHTYFRIPTILLLLLLVQLNIRLGHLYQYPWEAPYWDWSKLGDVYLKALKW